MGISESDFWHMNPRRMRLYIKAEAEKTKRELEFSNTVAYLQGQYMVEALLCTVGNMFSNKNAKQREYPKKPYDLSKTETELTEEELQRQRELFVANYMVMMANFNLNHKSKNEN